MVALTQIAEHIRTTCPGVEFRFATPSVQAGSDVGLAPGELLKCGFLSRFKNESDIKRSWKSMFTVGMVANIMVNTEQFLTRMRGWLDLISSFKPDIVIGDFAPCLGLAAFGRVPSLVVGSAYTLPPPEADYVPPPYEGDQPDKELQGQLLEKLNVLLRQVGVAPIARLPQVNIGDAYGLMTIPAFDPYSNIRKQPYLGVVHPGGAPRPAATPGQGSFSYFSGFRSAQHAKLIASELVNSHMPGEAYLSAMTAEQLGVAPGLIEFRRKIANLAEALPRVAVVVHKGSLGVGSAALYAGVPQIILYEHDENWFNGACAMRAGIGASVELNSLKPGELAQAIRLVSQSREVRERVARQCAAHSHFLDAEPAAKVAEIALQLIGVKPAQAGGHKA